MKRKTTDRIEAMELEHLCIGAYGPADNETPPLFAIDGRPGLFYRVALSLVGDDGFVAWYGAERIGLRPFTPAVDELEQAGFVVKGQQAASERSTTNPEPSSSD